MPFRERNTLPRQPYSDIDQRRMPTSRHDERQNRNPERYATSYADIEYQQRQRAVREGLREERERKKKREKEKRQLQWEQNRVEAQRNAKREAQRYLICHDIRKPPTKLYRLRGSVNQVPNPDNFGLELSKDKHSQQRLGHTRGPKSHSDGRKSRANYGPSVHSQDYNSYLGDPEPKYYSPFSDGNSSASQYIYGVD